MTTDGSDWQRMRRGARRKARQPRWPMHANSASALLPVKHENVSDDKRRAIQQRVTRISEALKTSSLLRKAVDAIAAHFPRSQAAVDAGGEEGEQPLDVVAYGLGSFSASSNAVYQLAFLVAMVQELAPCRAKDSGRAEVFDPVMNESDTLIAEHFELKVLSENECGRRRTRARTVFFMPHCGKSLYENVVASNWGRRLRDVVIIGNSFTAYSERIMDASEREKLLLLRALPFLTETPLPVGVGKTHDEFSRYEAAFNDLSVLVFPNVDAIEQDEELAERMAHVAAGVDKAPDQDELITSQ